MITSAFGALPRLLAATALAATLAASPVRAETTTDAAPFALGGIPLGRLDGSVVPQAYRLDLTVNPAEEWFSGHAEIDVSVKRSHQAIYLHGRDLVISGARASFGGKTIRGNWNQVDPTGVVRLTFGEPLPEGPVTLSFDYRAQFNSGPAGMFRVHVGDQWYSWTQHQSIDARASFPSFDEPGFKTPFTVTLRTPKGQTAISNAPETGTTDEGDVTVHRFAPTLPLPTYLVAMMVGPFAEVESIVPPTPQRAEPLPLRIISPQTNAGKLTFALENSKPIVTLLEDYFGQPFPYPKLDQITSPIMPGAMENAGADLYGDSIIILDDAAPVADKRGFGMVVAHELAHQWFGDLVTPAWWDDIWLNESFANWMGYRIGAAWRPDLNIGSGANAEGFAAMNTDALVAGRPIHQPIERNSQVDAAFDTITYGKGGHVVAMIAAFMGDERFRDGVRRYMAAHKYGNATSADFFGAMADVAGDPRILPAMQSFTSQQGVPLITFERAGKGWKITQQRYARLGTVPPETRWGVPLCLRQGKNRSCTLFGGKEMMLGAVGKGALMPNAGGTGYYRFELPARDWDALIARASTLSGNEALALADSLRASYLAGRASVRQVAALARRLAANPDSHANGAALNGMETLRAAGLFDNGALIAYRRFVTRTLLPSYKTLGFDPKQGAYASEDSERTQRRLGVVDSLARTAKVKEVHDALSGAAGTFFGGQAEALDPMWYDLAFGAWLDGQATGGKAVEAARDLFGRALATQDPALRPALLRAVANSGDKAIAAWILNEASDSRLRASERLNLVRGIVSTGSTRDLGYEWMKANLDSLLSGNGGIFFASRLPQMVGGYCSIEKAQQLATDLRPRLAGKTSELELERTIERVRSCGLLQTARKAEASAEMKTLR